MTHGDKHPVVGGIYLVVELKEKKNELHSNIQIIILRKQPGTKLVPGNRKFERRGDWNNF